MTTQLEHVLVYHDTLKEFQWTSKQGNEEWILYVNRDPWEPRIPDMITYRDHLNEEGVDTPLNWEVVVICNA